MFCRCYEAVEVMKNNDYMIRNCQKKAEKHRLEKMLVAAGKAKTEGSYVFPMAEIQLCHEAQKSCTAYCTFLHLSPFSLSPLEDWPHA